MEICFLLNSTQILWLKHQNIFIWIDERLWVNKCAEKLNNEHQKWKKTVAGSECDWEAYSLVHSWAAAAISKFELQDN